MAEPLSRIPYFHDNLRFEGNLRFDGNLRFEFDDRKRLTLESFYGNFRFQTSSLNRTGVEMSEQFKNLLAEDRLIRLREVLSLVPVSRSTWWAGVKAGIYPRSIKLGPKITCWRLSDILSLISTGVGRGNSKAA